MARELGPLISVMFTILLLAGSAVASTTAIENKALLVRYDDATATFSVAEKTSGLIFLNSGKLTGTATGAKAETVKDAVFGSGRRIRVARQNGGFASLELYATLPFLLVRGEFRNEGKARFDLASVVPASFILNLGKPADGLRTMGTAGLTAPDQNPGSYLFLTLADAATRRGVVAGFVTSDRGSGVLFSSVTNAAVEFRAQLDYGHVILASGESAKLETLAIGIFDDARLGEEQFADAIAKQYRIKLRPQVAGYCTWYATQPNGASNEKDILTLAEFAAKALKPFGFSFVQIDDGWQDGGQFNGPRRGFDRAKPDGPYPHGMKTVAERFRDLGLTAGIWFMPFARNHQDPEYQDRQHWFVKQQNGKPYETDWGGTSLDLTQPEVQAHLRSLAKTLHGWGYNYFKMDGLWTGTATEQIYVNDGYRDDHMGNNAPFHDPKKTNVEALRDGLKLLREAAGPEVFFSGCNLSQNMRSLAGSVGLVDSMRIGPDNGRGWRDYHEEINRNRSDSLVTGPVRGTRLYFLHGRVWWNDPDPSYVRASIPLPHAQLLASWVALSDQFYLNSDWLPSLPAERLDILKRTMPAHGVIARPVDYFDTIMPGIWLVTDTRHPVRRDVLGLFNWESHAQTMDCTAPKAGLDSAKTYHAFDFWSNALLPSFRGGFKFEVPAQSCRVLALRADEGHPVVLSTSRHVTQGIVEITDEEWRKGKLSATSKIIGHDPYELRIAGLTDGRRRWKLVSAGVSENDKTAGVTLSSNESSGLLRVTIQSPASRPVKWALHFD